MRVRVVSREFELREPYTIAYESFTHATNHFVVLEENGEEGVGCAAPAIGVTGESAAASRAALDRFASQVNGGAGSDQAFAALSAHDEPSARAGVEMALTDLRLRKRGASLLSIRGPARAPKQIRQAISVTIGIGPVERTLDLARQQVDRGFSILKVKGGHDAARDIRRIHALRSELPDEIVIALDANQGYVLEDVIAISREQPRLRLAYLEQPTPAPDLALLAAAARNSDIPVMADESICGPGDVQTLVALGGVDLVNIKVQKVGGLDISEQIDAMCRTAGIRTMLGCMDESALSIAAALQFGARHDNVQWYDLDGHLDLIGDPFSDLLRLDDGHLVFETGAGLSRPAGTAV